MLSHVIKSAPKKTTFEAEAAAAALSKPSYCIRQPDCIIPSSGQCQGRMQFNNDFNNQNYSDQDLRLKFTRFKSLNMALTLLAVQGMVIVSY